MWSSLIKISDVFYDYAYETFLEVDEFQWKLLKYLLGLLSINFVCIWFAWNVYGNRITERFMKPAASKLLEDLKREATELKLPKEHTPRI